MTNPHHMFCPNHNTYELTKDLPMMQQPMNASMCQCREIKSREERIKDMVKNMKIEQADPKVLPSEAIYLFAAWLSGHDEILKHGLDDCAIWADFADQFCKHNNFEEVRDDVYPKNLECPPAKEKV